MLLLQIITKVFISSGILFSYYWLFLRNKRFHRYNRFYLIGIVLVSTVIPFINIPIPGSSMQEAHPAVLQVIDAISVNDWDISTTIPEQKAVTTSTSNLINWQLIGILIYTIIIALLLVHFVRSLLYIRNIRHRYPSEKIKDFSIYDTNEPGTPFSFFRSIFWNQQIQFNSQEGQHIFRHELFHVRQRHSADLLLMEIVCAIAWFNPIFYLIRKELKAIHEFLADQYAISDNDRYSYAETLLAQSIRLRKIQLVVHPFFHTQIKRRIAMITQLTNNKYGYGSRVMILPLLLFLFCVITVKAQQLSDEFPKTETDPFISENPTILTDESLNNNIPFQVGDTVKISSEEFEKLYAEWKSKKQPIHFEGNMAKNNFYFISPPDKNVYQLTKAGFEALRKKYNALKYYNEYNKIFTKTEIEAEYPGGENAWNRYLEKNLRNPVDASGKKIEAVVEVQFIVDKNGIASDYRATGGNSVLQKEAIRLITQIKWIPAVQNGQIVKAYKKKKIAFGNNPKTIQEQASVSSSPTDYNMIFTKVEIEPAFPGGEAAWVKFLMTNISYPQAAKDKKIKGKVIIRFIVNNDGSLRNIEALEGPELLTPEAIRLITISKKWLPAIQNGIKVAAYCQQAINFDFQLGSAYNNELKKMIVKLVVKEPE